MTGVVSGMRNRGFYRGCEGCHQMSFALDGGIYKRRRMTVGG